MIPLYDSNPTKRFPVMTVLIIIATFAVYYLQATSGNFIHVVNSYGAIPAELYNFTDIEPRIAYPVQLTVLTSMFMHGGLFHLLGNMLFLWIFGNNVEDIFGRLAYLTYYLLCGIGAVAAHVLGNTGSDLPLVGASGAISGLMAAYLISFPRAKVHILFWFFVFFKVIPVPAWLVITFWLLMQLSNLGVSGLNGPIAWGAHVGGFATGLILYPFYIRYAGGRNRT